MRSRIAQYPAKKNCGVIAVAVIAGITVDEAAKAIGKTGCTKAKDLAKGLQALGWACPSRCKRMPRPPLGIGHLKIPTRKSGWHWVVVDGNKTWDGGQYGNPDGTVNWPPGWRITSYLPVWKPGPEYDTLSFSPGVL
jgi:hypothetical protein